MTDGLRTVEAMIRYLGDCHGKPTFYGIRKERNNLPLEPHTVRVTDMRPVQDAVSLDREGFALVRHATKVTDFFEPAQVRETYMRELEEVLQQVTGAARVVASGSVYRRSERATGLSKQGSAEPVQNAVLNKLDPARFAHCDFSRNATNSSFWVEQDGAFRDEAKARPGRRFAFYNLWRVLSEPPQDSPLAVCDARSVAYADRVASDYIIDPPGAPKWKIETSQFRYSPDHRWCYFSGMTRDEVLVFKGYESDPAQASGVPHTAFDDPSCPPGAPARESIDVRAFAFFD